MKALLIVFIFIGAQVLNAQTNPPKGELEVVPQLRSVKNAIILNDTDVEKSFQESKTEKGELKTEQDENIKLLIQDYIDHKKFNGYRIQLFAGNSKLDAIQVKSNFISKYDENYPEVIYQVPNFKVRVGNFKNRLEATKMLETYKADFPYAFIVQDEIELKK